MTHKSLLNATPAELIERALEVLRAKLPDALPEGDRAAAQAAFRAIAIAKAELESDPATVARELAEIEGLPQQEVADRLGLSLSGAKSRIQRGRAMLKDALERCCRFEFDRRGNLAECDPLPDRKVCRNCDDLA